MARFSLNSTLNLIKPALFVVGLIALLGGTTLVALRPEPPCGTAAHPSCTPLQAAMLVQKDTLPRKRSLPFLTGADIIEDLNLHPSQLHPAFVPDENVRPDSTVVRRVHNADLYEKYYAWLDLQATRYGVDDNFTIRVFDNRSGRVLEVFTLDKQRNAFLKSETAPNWGHIDGLRSEHTKELVQKYTRMGIPKAAITIKWGRLNQVFEAFQRDEPYVEYELRLARRHGLSAVSAELGTVETFNQDHMVSRVGARGRYQFMPDRLKRAGLKTYPLRVHDRRTKITVREEQHPLLLMEHAFILMRGYANAVGHEFPGLSAYHSGPANMLNLYRLFLENEKPDLKHAHVMDAYAWGVTIGFPKVSERSSFRDQSRAYLPAAYGAFRATEILPVDFSKTIKAELVTLQPGVNITLTALLKAIAKHGPTLDWGYGSTEAPYDNFVQLNPHLPLPLRGSSAFVPADGNVVFQYLEPRSEIRIFLPLGTAEVLHKAGFQLFDLKKTQPFDESTFQDPDRSLEKTLWDSQYEALVDDIAQFGFNTANRDRLFALYEAMKVLAEKNPTPYRIAQAEIIRIHKIFWSISAWRNLVEAVDKVQKRTAQLDARSTPERISLAR